MTNNVVWTPTTQGSEGKSDGDDFFADFMIAQKHRFALKNGQLFSPLERQRIVSTIAEGAEVGASARTTPSRPTSCRVLPGRLRGPCPLRARSSVEAPKWISTNS